MMGRRTILQVVVNQKKLVRWMSRDEASALACYLFLEQVRETDGRSIGR